MRGWWPEPMEAGRIYSQSGYGVDAMVCGQAGSLYETLKARRSAKSAAAADWYLLPGRAMFLLVGLAHRIVDLITSIEHETIVIFCADIDEALKVLSGLPAQIPVTLAGSARPLYQARITLGAHAPCTQFAPLVERVLEQSRAVSAMARISHGLALARRVIETATHDFHYKANPALVHELAEGMMGRAAAYGKMTPRLHRDGKDDALLEPCALAYRLSETKFALRFLYRVLAVDQHRGELNQHFSRLKGMGPPGEPQQATRRIH